MTVDFCHLCKMVRRCVVPTCKNRGSHRFPKNEKRRSRWLQAIKHLKTGVTDWRKLFICSAHFKPNDFSQTTLMAQIANYPDCYKTLNESAIPSIFPGKHKLQNEPSEFKFDASKLCATYSRQPRVLFVNELPFCSQSDEIKTEDPLQLSDQEIKEEVEFDQTDNDCVKIEISSDYCHETHELQIN